MACDGLKAENGKSCYKGNVRGFTILPEKWTGSKEDLAKKSTWEQMAIDGASTVLNAPDNEKTPATIIATSLKFVADIPTGTKQGGIMLKFVDNAYTKSMLDGLGAEVEVFFHTDKDEVLGEQTVNTNERTSTLVSITPLGNVNGDLDMIDVMFTYLNDYTRKEVSTSLEAGFTSSDIPTWKGLQLAFDASLATSLSFKVQDIGEIKVEDIDENNVTLFNVTDNIAVSILTFAKVADLITVTFATLSGKEVRPSYAVPTLATDLFYVEKTFTELLP